MKAHAFNLLCRLLSKYFVPRSRYNSLLERNAEIARERVKLAIRLRTLSPKDPLIKNFQ